MRLTGRQKDFLGRFLDLYREARTSLHYTHVAEKLGVGKITAYDMLRLLEERGLVTSEYFLPEGERGRGRSSIVFRPTEKASAVLTHLAGKEWDTGEWEEVKEKILQSLRKGQRGDYEDILNEILLRIPKHKSPMLYMAEMITAVILNLHQLRGLAVAKPFEKLRALGLPGELGLSTLAGLIVGLSFVERANRRFTTLLLSYTQRYQEYLVELSSDDKQRLSDFAQEVLKIVGT